EDEFRTVAQWRKPGLRVPERAMEATSEAYNQKYFARWHQLLTISPFRVYYRYIARKYEPRFANYGYSLTKGFEEMICGQGKFSAAVGALCCVGADAGAFIQRLLVRSKPKIRVMAKAVLPGFIVDWVREARQRKSLDTGERKGEVVVGNGADGA